MRLKAMATRSFTERTYPAKIRSSTGMSSSWLHSVCRSSQKSFSPTSMRPSSRADVCSARRTCFHRRGLT